MLTLPLNTGKRTVYAYFWRRRPQTCATNLRTGDVKEAGPTQALHDVRCLYFFLLAAAAAAALAFLSDSSASE